MKLDTKTRDLLHTFGNRFGVHAGKVQYLKLLLKQNPDEDISEVLEDLFMTYDRMKEVWLELRKTAKNEKSGITTTSLNTIISRLHEKDFERLERTYGVTINLIVKADLKATVNLNLETAVEITENIVITASHNGADNVTIVLTEQNEVVNFKYKDNGEELEKASKPLGLTGTCKDNSLCVVRDLVSESGGFMQEPKLIKGLGSEYSIVYRKAA